MYRRLSLSIEKSVKFFKPKGSFAYLIYNGGVYMKKYLTKAVAIIMSLILTMGTGSAAAFAQSAQADPDASYYKGAYYYRPGAGEYFDLYDNIDYYTYTDDYFKASGRVFNEHLATMSLCLAEASVSSTREPFSPDGYANKNRDAKALLEDLGFSDIQVNTDYTVKPTIDSMGVACAHKRITDGSDDYTLLVILPRSAGYEAEWGNNFILGADGDAKGFADTAVKCLDYAEDYIAEHGISGNIKVWCVGYSRGAAISNILAKNLIDDPQEWLSDSIALTPDNIYCYNFGTPSGADSKGEPHSDRYAGIFNFYTNTELASMVAPAEMGFERYGTDIHLPDWDRYDDMLDKLEICAPLIHEIYSTQLNSTLYHPKKLSLIDGAIGLVDDDDSYMPDNAAEYLAGEMAYLTQIAGGRENYHAVYEKGLSALIAYYESLTGDSASAFTDSLISNENSVYLIAAMYAYYMKQKVSDSISMNMELIREKAKEIAVIGAGANESTTGVSAQMIAKVMAKLVRYLLMKPENIKSEAAGYLGDMLRKAMTESGATDEQIASLSDQKDLEALVHFISYLLLGNIWQSDNIQPLNPDNEQIKAAATLLGNAACLSTDHTNEVIKSWLRLDDSYYSDYSAMTSARIAGYRRVYFNHSESLNAVVTDSEGKTVASIHNGVLDNSADKWIGFTNSDAGGFFRFPLDESYTVTFIAPAETDISVHIDEYNVDTATVSSVFNNTQTAALDTYAVLSLPALDEPYTIPSSVSYSLKFSGEQASGYILGDVDGDGVVTIIDATMIQRTLVDLPVTSFIEKAADVDGNGLDITDATYIQRYIAAIDIPFCVGEYVYDIQYSNGE